METHVHYMKNKRYTRHGKCNRCGWCCLKEDCENFEMSDEVATCKIHGQGKRELKCKLFPALPPILNSKCGYYFTDDWENDRKVKVGEV